jgi:phosphoglycerate dehydrogenase-like enzyme
MKLVFTRPDPDLREAIIAACPDVEVSMPENLEEARREMRDADAVYGYLSPELLTAARRLRWVQCPRAALETVLFPELISHPSVMTNMRGVYADVVADHVMTFLLMFARGIPYHLRAQSAHEWPLHYTVGPPCILLCESTLGIVGLGEIGRALSRRAAAADMKIIAVDARQKEPAGSVSELWGPRRLGDLLEQSDFVAVCLPETPETIGLIGEEQLSRMKPAAYLINVGRGRVVRLDALTAALQAGRLAGAGLDVFEIEPLPSDHPLWDMPNVLITPHQSARGVPESLRRKELLVENVLRFVENRPLLNLVDKTLWY